MTMLSPHARQILDHLVRDRLFPRSYDPEPLFHQWDNYVQRVSFFNRYPDMTDHGRAHADSVVALVAQLSLPARGETPLLNASEIFCLTGAAWLHDIGMYTTGDTGDDIFDPMSIRARHCCLSRDKMRDERDLIFPGLPDDDVWIISAIAAYHQSRTAIDDHHARILWDAARKRGKALDLVGGMPTLERELESQGWRNSVACLARLLPPGVTKHDASGASQPIRVKLLAAILRLLDQCDIQMIRAGNLDFLVRRVSRSEQQQALYRKLREVFVPREGSTEGERLQKRLDGEIDFFSQTHDFCLRDFWVERTFIVGNRILIKLNDAEHIQSQLDLVPPSLDAAKQVVLNATRPVAFYLEHARDYIQKELALLADTYLKPAGLDLHVEDFPTDPKARRLVQAELRARAPYDDPAPLRPEVLEPDQAIGSLASRMASGNEGRIAVVYGPPGRGRKQFCRSLAEAVLQQFGQADMSSMWWQVIDRGGQANDAVRRAGTYLASHGDFALFNVMHEETLITSKHVEFFLKQLTSGDLPRVIVLQDLNRVEAASRGFFRELFRRLHDKVIIATTTRRPSPDAETAYFGGVEEQVRFIRCPRISQRDGRAALGKIARRARIHDAAIDSWIERWNTRWDQWGREAAFLGILMEFSWLFRSRPASVEAIVDARVRSGLVHTWERLGDRAAMEALLTFTEGQNGEAASGRLEIAHSNRAIQDLGDRDLIRWERASGSDPWAHDDATELSTAREEPGRAAWLHRGLLRWLTSSERETHHGTADQRQ
jgi:hypothetical protein